MKQLFPAALSKINQKQIRQVVEISATKMHNWPFIDTDQQTPSKFPVSFI
jgi:hypothetical protein